MSGIALSSGSSSKREVISPSCLQSSSPIKHNNNNILVIDEEEEFETSLRELISTESLKWIFVGGKGGVGKTTTSCAIATELSKHRKNVLILSTDPAHNLSDAFNQKFSETATLVNGFKNLYAMEIDSRYEESLDFRMNDSSTSSWMKMLPEILQTFPGVDEALSFAELMQSVQTMQYSVIVFDTAPTGHTLRLLSFPDLLENALNKLTSIKQQMAAALNMINSISGSGTREDDVIGKMENLKAITTSVREAFQDPSRTTFVCVCIPEFLSVFETERLVQELARQNIDCSNIVVNQVLFPIEEGKEEIDEEMNDEKDQINEENIFERKSKFPRKENEKEFLEVENETLRTQIKKLKKKIECI